MQCVQGEPHDSSQFLMGRAPLVGGFNRLRAAAHIDLLDQQVVCSGMGLRLCLLVQIGTIFLTLWQIKQPCKLCCSRAVVTRVFVHSDSLTVVLLIGFKQIVAMKSIQLVSWYYWIGRVVDFWHLLKSWNFVELLHQLTGAETRFLSSSSYNFCCICSLIGGKYLQKSKHWASVRLKGFDCIRGTQTKNTLLVFTFLLIEKKGKEFL